MSERMRATCPDCGARLVWQATEDDIDELAERIRTLQAERLRPTPPTPTDPRRHRGTL